MPVKQPVEVSNVQAACQVAPSEGASKTSEPDRRVINPRKMRLRRGRASSSMARPTLKVSRLLIETRGAGVANCSGREARMLACLLPIYALSCEYNTIVLVLASRW